MVQLGADGQIVEVGAEDHDRIETLRQSRVFRDDGVDGRLGVAGPVGVGDPDGVRDLLMPQGLSCQQRLRDAVGLQGLHQRPEETHRPDLTREQLQHA